jgi:Carboxypeptidase regulatory-like domain
VSVGRFSGAGLRFSGLVGYELGSAQAEGDAGGSGRLVIRHLQHGIGVGLRAAFLLPPAPLSLAPATPPAVRAPPPPAPAGSVVRGVVRSAHSSQAGPAGVPLAGVRVGIPGRPPVTTDSHGTFVLEGLAPGLITLHLEGADLMPEEEVLSVPPEGEVSVDLLIRPLESARLAAIIGLVRSEEGAPLPARVSIPELELSTQADGNGRFRIEVPAGRYTLVIEAPGLIVQRKPVTVGAGEHSIHNVDLQRER